MYTCSSFEPIVRKRHFELIWITRSLFSLDICAQKMFEILTIQIIILNEKLNKWSATFTFYYKLISTRDTFNDVCMTSPGLSLLA